jgi:hypothetical protein
MCCGSLKFMQKLIEYLNLKNIKIYERHKKHKMVIRLLYTNFNFQLKILLNFQNIFIKTLQFIYQENIIFLIITYKKDVQRL